MHVSQGAPDGIAVQDCLSCLCPILERHARQRFGAAISSAAWQDFSRWGEAVLAHEQDSYQRAFAAWWLFCWMPDDQHLQEESFTIVAPDHAIAADYLALHRTRLGMLEQQVTERALKSPYSFYSVLSVETDSQWRLQNIYTQEHLVVEVGDNIRFAIGEVLFTAVLSVNGVSVLLGCMPYALNASCQAEIEAHRVKWRADVGRAIDLRLLYLHDTELRRYYFLLLGRMQQARLH